MGLKRTVLDGHAGPPDSVTCEASYSSADGAPYPGLDRFGRVVRQMWVDDGFAENSGSSAVPNIPPIVSIAYTYDTGSNRTGAFDARPKSSQPLSNMDAYDGLHRLVDARRGVWTGGLATPSVSQLKGSQQWALDPLGNWSSVGTDLDGAGGIDSDETELRDHRDPSLTPPTNRVNELYARELAPDTGGGTVDLGALHGFLRPRRCFRSRLGSSGCPEPAPLTATETKTRAFRARAIRLVLGGACRD